jgi:hypothetical protein
MQYRERFSRVAAVVWAAGAILPILVLLNDTDGEPFKWSDDCARYVEPERPDEWPKYVPDPLPNCVDWVKVRSYEREYKVFGFAEALWAGLVVGVYWAGSWIAASLCKK